MKHLLTYQGPLLLWCALIFFLSSLQGLPTVPIILHPDKFVHFIVFGVLGIAAYRAFKHQTSFPFLASQPAISAVVFAGLYGIADEFHQRFVPGRSFDVWDMLADLIGASVCVWIMYRMRKDRTTVR